MMKGKGGPAGAGGQVAGNDGGEAAEEEARKNLLFFKVLTF